MLGKTILLYTADRAGSRTLTASLRALGNEVVILHDRQSATDLISAQVVDVVLFDYNLARDLDRLAVAAAGKAPFVVLASDYAPEVLRDVFCRHGITQLIGRTETNEDSGPGLGTIDPREIVVTVEKLLENDLFGASKYLPGFAVDLVGYEVHGAGDRDELVEFVQSYLRRLGAGREAVDGMGLVVDELVTNAVYNAPRDEHGLPRYQREDRRNKIELDPWERPAVQFGSDGRVFVFSISDWFGSIEVERVRERLFQCLSDGDQMERKSGGAGLGLYTVLQSVGQLIINVAPGERTEVIVVMELDRKTRARRRGHSMQLYVRQAEEVTQQAVVVSADLRTELVGALAPDNKSSRGGAVVPLRAAKRLRTSTRFDTDENDKSDEFVA